jgi:hypothetical protein
VSGWDWFVIAVLAGAVIVDVVFDQLRARRRRRLADDYDAEEHRRLMHELRRQP